MIWYNLFINLGLTHERTILQLTSLQDCDVNKFTAKCFAEPNAHRLTCCRYASQALLLGSSDRMMWDFRTFLWNDGTVFEQFCTNLRFWPAWSNKWRNLHVKDHALCYWVNSLRSSKKDRLVLVDYNLWCNIRVPASYTKTFYHELSTFAITIAK